MLRVLLVLAAAVHWVAADAMKSSIAFPTYQELLAGLNSSLVLAALDNAMPLVASATLSTEKLSALLSKDFLLTDRQATQRWLELHDALQTSWPDVAVNDILRQSQPVYQAFLAQAGIVAGHTFKRHPQAKLRGVLLAVKIAAIQQGLAEAPASAELKLGLNYFAILDPMEARFFTGNVFTSVDDSSAQQDADLPHRRTLVALPAAFDLRNTGLMPPIRNQMQCGSCWAFTAAGTLELQNLFVNGYADVGELSEQQLVSCDTLDDGCDGGTPVLTFKWIKQTGGLVSNLTYPYSLASSIHDKTPKCNDKLLSPKLLTASGDPVALPKQPKTLADMEATELAIQATIFAGFPVTFQIGASSSCFQGYQGGVLTCDCHGPIDHVVLAIGWDENSWIIRNQWGTSWGEQGYGQLARYRISGTCEAYSGPLYLSAVASVGVPETRAPTPPTKRVVTSKPTPSQCPVSQVYCGPSAQEQCCDLISLSKGDYSNLVCCNTGYCAYARKSLVYCPSLPGGRRLATAEHVFAGLARRADA